MGDNTHILMYVRSTFTRSQLKDENISRPEGDRG